MPTQVPTRRPSRTSRRFGYLAAAAAQLATIYVVHAWWDDVPFITDSAGSLIWLVTLSLMVGAGINLIYVVSDPPWLRALGDIATSIIALVVVIRIWRVFPFAFEGSFDWAGVVRVVLIVAMFGTAVSMVVQIVALSRAINR